MCFVISRPDYVKVGSTFSVTDRHHPIGSSRTVSTFPPVLSWIGEPSYGAGQMKYIRELSSSLMNFCIALLRATSNLRYTGKLSQPYLDRNWWRANLDYLVLKSYSWNLHALFKNLKCLTSPNRTSERWIVSRCNKISSLHEVLLWNKAEN